MKWLARFWWCVFFWVASHNGGLPFGFALELPNNTQKETHPFRGCTVLSAASCNSLSEEHGSGTTNNEISIPRRLGSQTLLDVFVFWAKNNSQKVACRTVQGFLGRSSDIVELPIHRASGITFFLAKIHGQLAVPMGILICHGVDELMFGSGHFKKQKLQSNIPIFLVPPPASPLPKAPLRRCRSSTPRIDCPPAPRVCRRAPGVWGSDGQETQPAAAGSSFVLESPEKAASSVDGFSELASFPVGFQKRKPTKPPGVGTFSAVVFGEHPQESPPFWVLNLKKATRFPRDPICRAP